MGLFGNSRDVMFIHSINNEVINNIVEQELLLYKYSHEHSTVNVYGESPDKFYNEPVIINHLMIRNDQTNTNPKYGTETNRLHNFNFYKQHLIEKNLYIDKGDIIEWQREFYEIDSIIENQLFGGKSENTHIEGYMNTFGFSVSVIAYAHLVRLSKLNIIDVREQ